MQRPDLAAYRPDRAVRLAAAAALLLAAACGDDTQAGAGGSAASSTTSSGTDAATSTSSGPGAGQGGDTSGTGPGAGGTGDGGAGTGGGTGGGGEGATTGSGGAPVGSFTVGPEDREVSVLVPDSYEHGTPTPLIILLHGYSASGAIQDAYFQMTARAQEYGFLYAYPDGTVDTSGERFWNATDACCNFYGSDVDDSAYLQGLVDEISERATVDPKRIYFVGHSNGGFMSYRMACEHADTVAAIASLAGATYLDTGACNPSEPVATLQIHGTADATILYAGGTFGASAYPGAEETVAAWASYDGCESGTTEGAPRDLSTLVAGEEATVTIHDQGCTEHGGSELWTIPGEGHIPALSSTFSSQIVEWLLAHPKP